MSDGTAIEWADASWNPIRALRLTGQLAEVVRHGVGWHCEHVSEGCRNCYAEAFNRRLGTGLDYKPGHRKNISIQLNDKMLLAPLNWKKPRKIFVCSMTDLFADFVTDEMIDQVFAVMALCPQHIFQVLTKRPERMRQYFGSIENGPGRLAGDFWRDALIEGTAQKIHHGLTGDDTVDQWLAVHLPLPNVWIGVSVEDQATADERIPILLDIAAAIRWLSMEPLLGPVDLTEIEHAPGHALHALWGLKANTDGSSQYGPKLDWIVLGGESGPNARPMHPGWARQIRDHCAAAGVPFLFKQWGEWAPDDGEGGLDHLDRVISAPAMNWADGAWHRLPKLISERDVGDYDVYRLGKKRSGRLLDGVQHDGYPA